LKTLLNILKMAIMIINTIIIPMIEDISILSLLFFNLDYIIYKVIF